MLIPINRAEPFDPAKFLKTSGFSIKSENQLSSYLTKLDTSRLRLEYGMYEEKGRPLFRSERAAWLESKGFMLPDGHIIEALSRYPECLAPLWDRPEEQGLPTIHLDGVEVSSTWDGRDFEIYALFNRRQQCWEFPYLGPWAGHNPSLVIDP